MLIGKKFKKDKVKSFFKPDNSFGLFKKKSFIAPIAAPLDREILKHEIEKIHASDFLFSMKNYSVYCPSAASIPMLMHEIGRQREITFRAIGEGTNKCLDLDAYDLYYHQLIIWDHQENALVGAYRLGKGNEIMKRYGRKGFYIRSLFRTKKQFDPILEQAIELGRSFVVKEYQRKPLSLFLLWKGILYFLLKNPDCRFLLGPVSISNDFTSISKDLIVGFLKQNHYQSDLSKLVKARNKYVTDFETETQTNFILLNAENSIEKLDKIIQNIETETRIPVLIKKYIQINAKLIGFNVDPKFNNSLDGFLILDILDIPFEFITSLSKEIKDPSILDRFKVAS